MNVANRRPPFLTGALPSLMALVAVFLLGGAGGYVVKGLSTPPAAYQSSTTGRPNAICPLGTHVVVWYTARTWACLSDVSG